MKIRFAIAILAGITILSCSQKLAVQPTATVETPVVSQTPVTVEGPMVLVAASPEEITKGKEQFDNICANCHKLFSPDEFSKEQWAPILVRMQKHGNIGDDTMASITNYIHSELQ